MQIVGAPWILGFIFFFVLVLSKGHNRKNGKDIKRLKKKETKEPLKRQVFMGINGRKSSACDHQAPVCTAEAERVIHPFWYHIRNVGFCCMGSREKKC